MCCRLLFSAEGRIGCASHWIGTLVISLTFAVTCAVTIWLGAEVRVGGKGRFHVETRSDGSLAATLTLLAYAIAAPRAGTCIGVKRYHDRDQSGFSVLIQFVPVLGYICYLIETGFLPGTDGPNRFGPDTDEPPPRFRETD